MGHKNTNKTLNERVNATCYPNYSKPRPLYSMIQQLICLQNVVSWYVPQTKIENAKQHTIKNDRRNSWPFEF